MFDLMKGVANILTFNVGDTKRFCHILRHFNSLALLAITIEHSLIIEWNGWSFNMVFVYAQFDGFSFIMAVIYMSSSMWYNMHCHIRMTVTVNMKNNTHYFGLSAT